MNALACLARLGRDARGVTSTEYAVLFVLIVVGTVSVWAKFGKALGALF
jgi:Flp pilus assembly pilin Flp